ncbi:calaxin-like [Euwallacea fornicatus]|uniref:calaxin-like n=1 Tax=Euwallacea fornicatus TaxID=995702 RepID=UPI00338D9562
MMPQKPSPRLSMRQGAIVLRGIARLLNRVRVQRRSGVPSQSSKLKFIKNRERRMGEKDIYKCSPKLIERMKRETQFNRTEIEALYKIYKKLVTFNKASGKLNTASSTTGMTNPVPVSEGIDRSVFREILHNTFDIVTENMLMDRIFCVWDKLNCGLITLESWFQGMSIFLKSEMSKQCEYCFAVYDLNGDGFVTKDEMFQLLKNCLIKFPQEEDPDESVKDLVDIVIRKMDKDKDGKVSLHDYQTTVLSEPLLLEAFGRCLPSDMSKNTFLTTLKF